jgi:hypothetical protein
MGWGQALYSRKKGIKQFAEAVKANDHSRLETWCVIEKLCGTQVD